MTNTDTPGEGLASDVNRCRWPECSCYGPQAPNICRRATSVIGSDTAAVEAVQNVLSGRYGIDHREGFSVVSTAKMRELAYKAALGSDTVGLPSDRAGLVEWLKETTSSQGDDAARLDWLEAHPAAEVVRREQEWPDNVQWEVCEIHGGRNDREWHVRGVGETVRDALDAAMLAARPVQGGSDE